MPESLPTVVIVGDESGITRDRLHGLTGYRGRRLDLIDTGGIVVDDSEYIPSQILKQARTLLRLGQPTSLAVNKADTGAREGPAHGFYSPINHDAIIRERISQGPPHTGHRGPLNVGQSRILDRITWQCRAALGHPACTKAALGRGITNEATPG